MSIQLLRRGLDGELLKETMKQNLKGVIAGLLLTATVTSAGAAVVNLGSINKTYGTGQSTASTGTGSCDTINANSITVTDASKCARFSDEFNFQSIDYSSIDHLTLTLTFGATNNLYLGLFREDWRVRFADSATSATPPNFDMTTASGTISQSFILNASQAAVFNNVVANGKMYLWFADQAAGANNFNLYSARLDVFGTEVPEPASLGLFGAALAALTMARRKKMR
jgi:hypothetical protein